MKNNGHFINNLISIKDLSIIIDLILENNKIGKHYYKK